MLEISLNGESGYVCVGKCVHGDKLHYYPFGGSVWHGVSGRDYGYDVFGNKNEIGCKRRYCFYWNVDAMIFSSREEVSEKICLWRENSAEGSISKVDMTCEYDIMSVEEYIRFHHKTEGYFPRCIDVSKYIRFV